MKALVLHCPGELIYEDVKIPEVGQKEVLIKVKAAGICGSDIPRIMDTGTYSFPCIPGHEFAGEISEKGKEVDSYNKGDRVVAAPLIPCGECHYCRTGNYSLCESYNFIGSRTDGAFAEYVKVPAENVLRLNGDTDFKHAAMIEPAAVTLHGMFKIPITTGDSVAILGLGPIGQFAVQWSKIMGAGKIYGVDVDPEKFEIARKIGCDETILASEVDPVQRLKEINDVGPDIVIETAGSHITQVQSIKIVKKKGQVLLLGTAHHKVNFEPEVWEKILRKEIVIKGAWNSYSMPFPGREWIESIKFLENASLKMEPMISHKINFNELPSLLKKIDENRNYSFNKIIVTP